MTYKATRYVRHGDGPHPCPDAHPADPHNLRQSADHPGTWFCLHALGQELYEADRARQEAEEAAQRQEKAEQIADEQLRAYNDRWGATLAKAAGNFSLPRQVRELLVAASLAGMEAAR
jgi:hypothetical protein